MARPSRWGNPYRVVRRDGCWMIDVTDGIAVGAVYSSKRKATEAAVQFYREHLDRTEGHSGFTMAYEAQMDLRGADLACWCPLTDDHGDPWLCHADVLLALAASPVES